MQKTVLTALNSFLSKVVKNTRNGYELMNETGVNPAWEEAPS